MAATVQEGLQYRLNNLDVLLSRNAERRAGIAWAAPLLSQYEDVGIKGLRSRRHHVDISIAHIVLEPIKKIKYIAFIKLRSTVPSHHRSPISLTPSVPISPTSVLPPALASPGRTHPSYYDPALGNSSQLRTTPPSRKGARVR